MRAVVRVYSVYSVARRATVGVVAVTAAGTRWIPGSRGAEASNSRCGRVGMHGGGMVGSASKGMTLRHSQQRARARTYTRPAALSAAGSRLTSASP
jgi:hypothetical protein